MCVCVRVVVVVFKAGEAGTQPGRSCALRDFQQRASPKRVPVCLFFVSCCAKLDTAAIRMR